MKIKFLMLFLMLCTFSFSANAEEEKQVEEEHYTIEIDIINDDEEEDQTEALDEKEIIVFMYTLNYKGSNNHPQFIRERKIHKQLIEYLIENDMQDKFHIIVTDIQANIAKYNFSTGFDRESKFLTQHQVTIDTLLRECLFTHVMCIFNPLTGAMRYIDTTEEKDMIDILQN